MFCRVLETAGSYRFETLYTFALSLKSSVHTYIMQFSVSTRFGAGANLNTKTMINTKNALLGIGSLVTSCVLAAKWYMRPQFPVRSSRENVASFKSRIGSTTTQTFYPISSKKSKKKKKSVYIRDRALFGLSKWLHMPSAALFFLRNKSHPLEFEVGSPRKDKLPILLFSHGIGGNCEIYSQLCADIADSGFIVVALEHEDGSASYAMNSNGEEIFYQFPPKDMPYTRQNVVKFRKPFLEQRKQEVESAFEHMKMLSESKDATHPFKHIADVVDFDRVAIGGHSFGGASTIHLNASSSSVLKPRCVLLHDPWPFCVSEKDINQGLNRPTLCMVGDRFRNSPEYAITEDLIEQTRRKNRVKVYSYHVQGATHSQFSDTPFWLPTPIATPLPFKLLGKLHDRDLVHDAIVKKTVSFLRHYCYGDGDVGDEVPQKIISRV